MGLKKGVIHFDEINDAGIIYHVKTYNDVFAFIEWMENNPDETIADRCVYYYGGERVCDCFFENFENSEDTGNMTMEWCPFLEDAKYFFNRDKEEEKKAARELVKKYRRERLKV